MVRKNAINGEGAINLTSHYTIFLLACSCGSCFVF